MKIQPVDFEEELIRPQPKGDAALKLVFKSRFKRLFERPFSGVLKISSPEKASDSCNRDGSEEFEPSTACLAKMVQNFIEEGNDKHHQKCARNRCNCFNGNCSDSSDGEEDSYTSVLSDACDVLKSLVPCLSPSERNLLADVAHLVEMNKVRKLKDEACRKSVADGLSALGYGASFCISKWEKSPMSPPGEHEYIDVVIDDERLIVDIDFRSEFEIARSTKAYRLVLQMVPSVFVGKADRLEKIIDVVSEAAKWSLKKKGMSFPPWRKTDYMKAKWLSPSIRTSCKDKESPVEKIQNVGGDCVENPVPPLEFKPRNLVARKNNSVKVKTALGSLMEEDQPQTFIGVLT